MHRDCGGGHGIISAGLQSLPKCGVVQIFSKYVNAGGCGSLSPRSNPSLNLNPNPKFSLTLASCKNRTRNLVLTYVSYVSTEPPQVVCLGTGSSVKLDPCVLPENQTTTGGLPRNWF